MNVSAREAKKALGIGLAVVAAGYFAAVRIHHRPSVAKAAPTADAAAPALTSEQVLASTLPGVVLLVNRHADGAIGFGSGVVLDDDGLVLTNVHVVSGGETLGALTYDPKRVSYIPQEGGLARYLFENDSLVVPARLVRGDPGLDLALVHINASTKGLKLPLRDEPAKQGERVMAVGHPGETVWSFTTGVVSSIHQDMLQTDAAINRGNSGGPLIDASGRVVGINTSKLVGDIHGIGFARPIGLAKPLIEGRSAKSPVDRSTPELAVKTCARAWELASEDALDCVDDDAWWDWMQDKLRRKVVRMKLTGAGKADFERRIASVTKEKGISVKHASELALMRGEDPYAPGQAVEHEINDMPMLDGAAASYKKTFARASSAAKLRENLEQRGSDAGIGKVDEILAERDARIQARTGMKLDPANPRAEIELTKMGIRIEKTREVDPTHAWVAVTGRNLDATEYHSSLFLVRKPSGWQRVEHPVPAQEKTLPSDFPKSPSDYEADLDMLAKYETEGFRGQGFRK